MNTDNKKIYTSPTIESMTLELEQGIAAGSGASNVQTQQEWGQSTDDNRTLDW